MVQLLGPDGRPLARRSVLNREIGRAMVGSVRSPLPRDLIAGLTPEALACYMHEARQGSPEHMLELAKTIELRWPHYRSQIGTRKLAQIGLPRTVVAPTDDPLDVQIAEELQAILNAPAAEAGLMGALDALGKGYSATEIVWDRSTTPWRPVKYRWRNPVDFVWDRVHYEELRLKTDEQPTDGVALEPGKWIVHCPGLVMGQPIESGLAWPCAALYMVASIALRDWAQYVEVFGMPIRIGKVPAGTAEAERDDFLAQLVQIGTDAAAVISDTNKIDFLDGGQVPGAVPVFERLLEWLNKQASKVIAGQTSSAEGGTSLAHATQQEEVRQDLVASDARQTAAVWWEAVHFPYVRYNYGPDREVSRPLFITETPDELGEWSEALEPFLKAGLVVEASQIRDRFGLAEPAEDAETIGGTTDGGEDDPAAVAADLNARARGGDEKAARAVVRYALKGARRGGERGRAIVRHLTDHRIAAAARRRGLHVRGRVLVERLTGRACSYPTPGARSHRRRPARTAVHQTGAGAERDLVDELTASALDDWRDAMSPVVDVLQGELDAADSPEDFARRLEDALAPDDLEVFMRSLATATFTARGAGDQTDRPDGERDEDAEA